MPLIFVDVVNIDKIEFMVSRVQGFLQDSMDTLDYVMTRNNVMPRMNARVLGVATKYVDMSQHMRMLKTGYYLTHIVSNNNNNDITIIVFKQLHSIKSSSIIRIILTVSMFLLKILLRIVHVN